MTLQRTRHDTDSRALCAVVCCVLVPQWECVSSPTSSPLAIIFLCVSASVSTAPFTPNNCEEHNNNNISTDRDTHTHTHDPGRGQTSSGRTAMTSYIWHLLIMLNCVLVAHRAGDDFQGWGVFHLNTSVQSWWEGCWVWTPLCWASHSLCNFTYCFWWLLRVFLSTQLPGYEAVVDIVANCTAFVFGGG